jgi:hypothetical protein
MHPFSILTLAIFVAGYITARWDLVTRLYELAIFAWDHGVVVSAVEVLAQQDQLLTCFLQTRTAKGFAILSVFFFLFIIPVERLASRETHLVGEHSHARRTQLIALQHPRSGSAGISAREQLRRRGSF